MSSGIAPEDRAGGGSHEDAHRVCVQLTPFGHESLEAEAEREGVSLEDLIVHAAMYYLADVDAGRISRRFPRGSTPG